MQTYQAMIRNQQNKNRKSNGRQISCKSILYIHTLYINMRQSGIFSEEKNIKQTNK